MLLNTQKSVRLVRIWDPAIDLGKNTGADFDEYVKTLDISKLKFKPELKPMIFTVRPLSSDIVMDYVMVATSDSDRQKRCFTAAVTQVDNLVSEDGEHVFTQPWSPSATKDAEGKTRDLFGVYELMTAKERALFGPMTIMEIGEMVWQRSFLPRGIEGRFVPRPMSLRILVMMSSLSAEQARSLAEDGKTEKPPAPQTPSDEGSSAEPGNAIATEPATSS